MWTDNGPERDVVLLIAKSTLAAWVAWGVAVILLDTQAPAFAPFSAVLFVQISVYQSVTQCLRYVAAVVAGVALQAVFVFVLGSGGLAFGLVALVSIALSRWKALGSQGPQVATAAFFAYSLFSMSPSILGRVTQLVEVIAVVLIGGAIGVAVNLLVWPPLRYRSAEYGLRALARAMSSLVTDMSDSLRAGELDEKSAQQWRQRAQQLRQVADQARDSVSSAYESLYYNPRRLLVRRRRGVSSFAGYTAIVEALERILHQLNSATRSLERLLQNDGVNPADPKSTFFMHYGQFLASIQEITAAFARLDEDHMDQQTHELGPLTQKMRECHEELREHITADPISLTDKTRPFAVILVEVERLEQEFQHTFDILQQQVGQRHYTV